MPATSLEPLQATSYARGQRYRSHHDDDEGNTSPQRRLKTVFAYLQATGLAAGECGGATAFYKLRGADGRRLRVFPRLGRALMWNNWRNGERDMRTVHGGEPVTCDTEKIGLNAFFTAESTALPRAVKARSRPRGPKE